MNRKTYGKTASGVPITDELINRLAREAAAGYDVDEILRPAAAARRSARALQRSSLCALIRSFARRWRGGPSRIAKPLRL